MTGRTLTTIKRPATIRLLVKTPADEPAPSRAPADDNLS